MHKQSFKINKYIFAKVPKESSVFSLSIPYNNFLWCKIKREVIVKENKMMFGRLLVKGSKVELWHSVAVPIKELELGTGTRYKILGKYFNFVIIKQIN